MIIRCCKDKSDNGGESEPNERTSQEKSDGGDKKEEVEEIAYHRAGGRDKGRFDRFVRRSHRKRERYHRQRAGTDVD